ncbi:MAG: cytidylate kinase-like family protein [Butyrivibrio sp.]|nr:cytidylate kinase-like family protein [Butyrivibrio sp.]
MDNLVIAVTRTCGSGATLISRLLAKKMGINLYDRNLLRLASEDSGINEELFAKADENMKRGLLYKVSKKVYNGELIGPESDDFTSNDNLFNYQAKVLKELAKNESFICIGRAADFVLKEHKRLITVFIYAPMEVCIQREMAYYNITDKRKAEQIIVKTDKYRRGYYKYHTGKEWESPYNYDICLNTGDFTYEQCVDIILNYVNVRYGEV